MNSTSVTGLDSCSANYLFYLTAYEDGLCPIDDAARWTTGPFVLPSRQIIYNSFRVRVLNFNSTVYWKQLDSCSLKSTQFNVYYRSEQSQNWSKSHCIVKTDMDNVFSCEFLTCTEMKGFGYEVQIRVRGVPPQNTENVRVFYPSLENTPDQIPHITITALTSTSVRVAWKLAPSFCSRFPYCLTFLYHSDSAENKSKDTTTDDQKRSSIILRNLLPYTKYYFYAVTFHYGLSCHYQPDVSHSATGPFTERTLEGVPSRSPVLVCSLCDVVLHARRRDGTVRWQ
ncbi:---NA---, partial [Paramuricea clavata]